MVSTEIKIKRGSGSTPALADGELGFNKNTRVLSIGTNGTIAGNIDISRPIKNLTQTVYNNLSTAEKNNGTIYIIESDDAVVTQSTLDEALDNTLLYIKPEELDKYGISTSRSSYGDVMINNTIEELCAALPSNSIFAHYWTGDVSDRFGTIAAQLPYSYGQLYITKVQAGAADLKFTRYGEAVGYISKWTSTNDIGWSGWVDFAPASHSHTAAQVGAAPSNLRYGDYYCTNNSQINNAITAEYNAAENGSVRLIYLIIGADGLDLPGGNWHIAIYKTDTSYGFIEAQSYRSDGMRRKILWAGSWGSWTNISPDAFAPSGYGLGETPNIISDTNEGVNSGWYRFTPSTSNRPFSGDGWMRVTAYSSSFLIQEAFTEVSYQKATRWCNNGTWTVWEYVDPPMVAGVEYRTTERFNGQPVYAYFFNYGYYSNSTTLIPHRISGILTPISIDIMNNEQEILTNSSGMKTLTFDRTNIGISCDWNMGNVFFLMKYTK